MTSTDDIRRMEMDLGKAAAKVIPEIERAMKRGAQNVKEAQQEAFSGSPHFRRAARSVSYDRKGVFGSIGYEVGPTIGGAGSLADIAVEGGANGGGGSVDIDKPSQREAAKLEKYIGTVLDGLL